MGHGLPVSGRRAQHRLALPRLIALMSLAGVCAIGCGPSEDELAGRPTVHASPAPLGPPGPGIRGITVGPIESSLQPGRGYGSPDSIALLDHLAAMGANFISITPFGRVFDLRDTEIQLDFEAPYGLNRDGIRRFTEAAHARGIRVLLIPHLWVEAGGWRGEMDPGTPERWDAYRTSYRRFLLTWAQNAADAGADGLSLGVECKSWSGRFPNYWRALIADVRAIFPGFLTYSANWDEVDDVIFSEDLDYLGINAFYPLASEHGASTADYIEGAHARVSALRALSERMQKPILFVEVGYTTRTDAAVEPWLWPDGMDGVVVDEHEQARALAASFDAFLPEPWFAGFFVWRYYARLDDVSQEAPWGFSPHAKEAEAVLRFAFDADWTRDPRVMGLGPRQRGFETPGSSPFAGLWALP